MNPTFLPFVISWTALALLVLGLAAYRRVVAAREDDFLHVRESDSRLVEEQGLVGRKLESIDRWGKMLTVVMAVSGLALGCFYVYSSWVANNAAAQNVPLLR